MKKPLAFPAFDSRGIPLREIIAVHRQFSPVGSLAHNVGDGLLCALNPVYANVRGEFLRRGFSFTEENEANYYAFPLMALDDILEARAVPYRRNFPWLERLEMAAPGVFTLTELKRSELQFNQLFHECAHFVAHDLLVGTALSGRPKNADTLLRILLGESFANTVEALGALFAEGEIESYFLDANCHFRSTASEVARIRRFARQHGPRAAARVLFASFLYANYLRESLSAAALARIRRFAEAGTAAEVGALAKLGFTLSEQFRTTTTQLHLVKLGFAPDLRKLFPADPLARVMEIGRLRAQVEELLALATAGMADGL